MAYIEEDDSKRKTKFLYVVAVPLLLGPLLMCVHAGLGAIAMVVSPVICFFLAKATPIIYRCAACGAPVGTAQAKVCPICEARLEAQFPVVVPGLKYPREELESLSDAVINVRFKCEKNYAQTKGVHVEMADNAPREAKIRFLSSDTPLAHATNSAYTKVGVVSAELKKTETKRPASQLSKPVTLVERPMGGDIKVVSSKGVKFRWVKKIYTNGDVTMSDIITHTMWLYNANPCGQKTWADAIEYCNNLNYAGYSDWRLPHLEEFKATLATHDCFAGVKKRHYWSGTSSAGNTDDAWYMSMFLGHVGCDHKTSNGFVWPVRGGI